MNTKYKDKIESDIFLTKSHFSLFTKYRDLYLEEAAKKI